MRLQQTPHCSTSNKHVVQTLLPIPRCPLVINHNAERYFNYLKYPFLSSAVSHSFPPKVATKCLSCPTDNINCPTNMCLRTYSVSGCQILMGVSCAILKTDAKERSVRQKIETHSSNIRLRKFAAGASFVLLAHLAPTLYLKSFIWSKTFIKPHESETLRHKGVFNYWLKCRHPLLSLAMLLGVASLLQAV